MAMTRMFNIIHPTGIQMWFIPRPLVTNMSYMLADVSNSFASTLGGQAVANDYTNQNLLHSWDYPKGLQMLLVRLVYLL